MGKKIFITGGFGFIGSAVIKHLQNCGHEIFVFDDLSFGSRQFVEIPEDRFVRGNILDAALLQSAILNFRPEYVVHLAAVHFIPYCNEHPFESANINIAGTINVLNSCRLAGSVGKVLFASTAAVYPIFEEAIPESLQPAPSDIYGLSKMTGEELCRKFHLETGIPTVICRFFNAFGPNETNPHLIPAIQRQVLEGKRNILLGNTQPKRDFIHTYDMATAVGMLLDKFETGIDTFNLGRGIEYSVLEVIAAFEKALGQTLTIEADPARMRKSDRLHLLAGIGKLSGFTGWQPTVSLEEGIKTLIHS
jgi:UDP-glucose 4-epimerase